MHVQLVSGTYFPLLGVEAMIGRTLTDQDDSTQGNHPVAVVSYSWWKKDLARDPDVLNRTLKIGDTTYSIVGVAPPEFFGTEVGAVSGHLDSDVHGGAGAAPLQGRLF